MFGHRSSPFRIYLIEGLIISPSDGSAYEIESRIGSLMEDLRSEGHLAGPDSHVSVTPLHLPFGWDQMFDDDEDDF